MQCYIYQRQTGSKVTFETTTGAKVVSICCMYIFSVDFFCYHDSSYDCMTDIGLLTSTLKQFLSLNILYMIHKKLQELKV